MHPFERWLREHFGAAPPVGHCLRLEHDERWLRLHSLPGSKRYAEDEDERCEVRRRASAAASEVLPSGEAVWLVTGRFDDDARTLRLPEAPSLVFDYVGMYSTALFEGSFMAYATQATWPHPDFERLVDAVAQDALRVVWMSSSTGEDFAPYDGGSDLILETPERVQALRRAFPADWLSPRADGL